MKTAKSGCWLAPYGTVKQISHKAILFMAAIVLYLFSLSKVLSKKISVLLWNVQICLV